MPKCPECRSGNTFYQGDDDYTCLDCYHSWREGVETPDV